MATVYLSPTGSDSYTYAQAQNPATPWLTPGKVNTSATTGDTVSMAAGTYTWSTVVFTKSFTWTASTYGAVYLNAAGAESYWRLGAAGLAHTYNGLQFTNFVGAISPFQGQGQTSPYTTMTFNSCVFYGNQLYCGYGQTGMWGQHYNKLNTLLNNCLFYDNTNSSNDPNASTPFGSIAYSSSLTISIINSTFHFSAGGTSGIYSLFGYAGNAPTSYTFVVKNSIFENATGGTFKVNPNGLSSIVSQNNCWYLTSNNVSGTNDITSNPLLADPTNNNFRLSQSSPCIGAGTSL